MFNLMSNFLGSHHCECWDFSFDKFDILETICEICKN